LAITKNAILSLLIILAVGLSAWSIIISPAKTMALAQDPKIADSFMEEVVAIVFNKIGNPSLKLVTPKMIHYPENDKTDILTPHVTVFRQSPEPWYIDSDYAKTNNGISEILFWSHVNIHHLADKENPQTSLLTDSLTIYPDQQLASTNQAVTFLQPDTTVHAVGMLANLEAGTIKLISQTQGEYVPST
jgi:lipopolysaccharide export system protein LptC